MLSDLMVVVCFVLDLCVKRLAVLHLSFSRSTTSSYFVFDFLSLFVAPLILVLYTRLIASESMPCRHGILWKREMSMI